MYRLLLLAVLVVPSALAQPTWVELEASPYNDYRSEDISFVSADLGWAVDGRGRVHKTEDGGSTWTQTTSLLGYLRSTAFVSPTLGWVGTIGSQDQLYETRDGGATFTNVSDRLRPAIDGVCSLFAVSEDEVFGAGTYYGPAIFIKTTDGGATWTVRPLRPHLDTVIDVHFFDAQHGLAVGGTGDFGGTIRPRVIETRDGGVTWTIRHTVESVTRGWGWKLSFPTPDIGYMSVEKYDANPNAMILKTTDGGTTWAEIVIPNAGDGNLQSVGFMTPEVGWVSGRGTTSVTTDGGATWAQLLPGEGLDPNVNRFQFLGGVAYASGRKIHRLNTQSVATEAGPVESDALWGVDPNPARSVVRIRYRPAPGPATVDVFDALGRRVGSVYEAVADGQAEWHIPAGLAGGVYTLRIRTSEGQGTRAVTVIR